MFFNGSGIATGNGAGETFGYTNGGHIINRTLEQGQQRLASCLWRNSKGLPQITSQFGQGNQIVTGKNIVSKIKLAGKSAKGYLGGRAPYFIADVLLPIYVSISNSVPLYTSGQLFFRLSTVLIVAQLYINIREIKITNNLIFI